ncbi:hypothetical protein SDC9_169046 [bioreactor metagenome]|uniref:Uncharacterized protein n=1 Tax=bioreactor metagenome TaxID=1076179 RepID=A0A645G6A5_9ZZZZ
MPEVKERRDMFLWQCRPVSKKPETRIVNEQPFLVPGVGRFEIFENFFYSRMLIMEDFQVSRLPVIIPYGQNPGKGKIRKDTPTA